MRAFYPRRSRDIHEAFSSVAVPLALSASSDGSGAKNVS